MASTDDDWPGPGRALGPGTYYFEELAVGDHWATGALTLTDAHIVGFAGLSGDFFDLHMDDAFARDLGFPARVAHGLLGLSLLDGLKNRSDVRIPAIASLGWNWDFKAPLCAGDRIEGRVRIGELKATSKPERAFVRLDMRLVANGDTVAQDGFTRLLIRRRPA
ncbi:MAG: MaoC/PaaZ C-terminal domain-containing protein [Alphaproteobacteria bacterium]